MDTRIKTNNVEMIGTIVSDPEYSHEVYGERFYHLLLEVKRLSGVADAIPLMISERLFDRNASYIGTTVKIYGQFRSYNVREEYRNRLDLHVFVSEIQKIDRDTYEDQNEVRLDGYICREVYYRHTPLGREIADMLVAVNRGYGKSDYIPCICWGRNARFASEFALGTHIELTGRIQSREYIKKHEDGTEEQRTAYEVSVSHLEAVEREEKKCE